MMTSGASCRNIFTQ